jgi:hypothetical protein
MKVMTADIQNALQHHVVRKFGCKAGQEFEAFGIEYGTTLLIVQALYGLKLSGAAFRTFCAEQLDKMNFHSTTGDQYYCTKCSIGALLVLGKIQE